MEKNLLVGYTAVPTELLEDSNLSFSAKGIGIYIRMLSAASQDEEYLKKELMDVCKTEEDILACNELHREGYINFTLP